MKNIILGFVLLFGLVIGLVGIVILWRSPPAPVSPPAKTEPVASIEQTKEVKRPKVATPTPPRFRWSNTDPRQTYRYQMDSHIRLNPKMVTASAKWQEISLKMQGTLNVRLFKAETDDPIYVGFQLSPLSLQQGNQEVSDLAQLYERFFVVAISSLGKFAEFHFPAYMTVAEEQIALSESVSPLQLVLSDVAIQPPVEWDSVENHASGRYKAHYRWSEPNTVHKRKVAYEQLSDSVGELWQGMKLSAEVAQSDGKMTLSPSGLFSIALQELVVFSSQGGKFSEVRTHFTLEKITAVQDAHLDIWQMPEDASEVLKRLATMTMPASGPAHVLESMRSDRLREKFAGVSVNSLFDRLVASQDEDAWLTYGKQLTEYLQVYPDAALELSRLLRTNLYSSDVSMTVITALERAGHLPAQKALLELINDPRAEANIQVAQATVSAGGILHPDPLLTEGLWQLVEIRAIEYDTALLALGRLSSALDADGDAAAAGVIRTRLTQLLQQADVGNSEQFYVLLGLGNASNDEVYPTIAPYLEAENVRVRSAAVQALRTFNDSASYQALLEMSTQDAEDQVRRQAFESLTIRAAKQSPDPDTITTIAQHLSEESSSQVRTEMIRFLGQHKNTSPEALNALQAQLRQETDREMLKIIYRALYQVAK